MEATLNKLMRIIVLAGSLIVSACSYAAETHTSGGNFAGNATPTKYVLTISAIEFHKVGDGATVFVPFVDTSAEWDIASANPDANIGTMSSTKSLPAGTYDKIRFTVSKTMTIQGATSSLSGGAPSRTESDAQTVTNPFGAGVLDIGYLGARDGAASEPETVTVPSGSDVEASSDFTDLGTSFRGVLTLPNTFTISGTGGLPMIKLKFDVTNAMQFVVLPDQTNRCIVFPGPPSLAVDV